MLINNNIYVNVEVPMWVKMGERLDYGNENSLLIASLHLTHRHNTKSPSNSMRLVMIC